MATATIASRAAVVCVAVLAVLHLLGAAIAATSGFQRGAGLLLGFALIAAAIGIARGNHFEARLAAVVVCVLDLVTLALEVTVGLPGDEPEQFDLAHLGIACLTTGVVALVAADAHARRARPGGGDRPPYAL